MSRLVPHSFQRYISTAWILQFPAKQLRPRSRLATRRVALLKLAFDRRLNGAKCLLALELPAWSWAQLAATDTAVEARVDADCMPAHQTIGLWAHQKRCR